MRDLKYTFGCKFESVRTTNLINMSTSVLLHGRAVLHVTQACNSFRNTKYSLINLLVTILVPEISNWKLFLSIVILHKC